MIAYLTCGKTGLHSFTHKELTLLEKNEVDFIICLTQLKKGIFMPKDHWKIEVISSLKIILGFIFFFSYSPLKFMELFIFSLKESVLRYFLASLSFYKLLKYKVDFVHCQMGDHKLVISYFLSNLLDSKLTTTIHAHELYSRLYYNNVGLVQHIFSYCAKIITISLFNKNELINRFNLKEDDISVMYLYPANFNENYFTQKKILIVANWFKKKGYEQLFQALKLLKREDYVLWAVGGWTKEAKSVNLYELVNKYSLTERVILLGEQPKNIVDILYASCDIFCLPSITDYYEDGRVREKEGIPVAVMEAVYWEKPVIVTDHAGNKELVKSILVKEFDTKELAAKINFLLDHPSSGKEIAELNKSNMSKFSCGNIRVLTNVFLKRTEYEKSIIRLESSL